MVILNGIEEEVVFSKSTVPASSVSNLFAIKSNHDIHT